MAHTSILEVPVTQSSNREGWFVLGGILGLLSLGLLLLKVSLNPSPSIPTSSDLPAIVASDKKSPETERHYAIICSGFTKTNQHAKWFGNSSSQIYKVLKEQYGYSDESIYFLFDDPKRPLPNEPVVVDGQMNLENFRKVIHHLESIVTPADNVSLFMIGHGIYRNADSWFDCIGKDLSSTEFADQIDRLNTKNIHIVLSPCQMEGFIWRASKKGRVILSSTRFTENNSAAVAEAAIRGFSNMKYDSNGDGRLSFAEAYQSMVIEQTQWYAKKGWRQREHALLDDNGDGMGHYLPTELDSGDGALAEVTFLGNHGKKIAFVPEQDERLKAQN
ncbi:MAG: hypothetical protein QF645_11865, partial [Planctomycetota bacterium]|nr:hypothetical protein [Planctomycetota bacterium]